MWSYTPPVRDMLFVIQELLEVHGDWRQIPLFAELDAETAPQILDAAGKFAVQSLAPINAAGDSQGCLYDDGSVKTPDGFAAAYQHFCSAGWPALACDPADGGHGMPQILNAALYEMLFATNHAWSMYPALAHGAYSCLRAHAPEHIKAAYLKKVVSGEWLATMCLTEPQAGSDVGLVRTRAEPQTDGSYAITGSKIFISGGDHDLTSNIVHLVLARLPDAPIGSKGVSLFVVPKYIPDAQDLSPNALHCAGIENKMGIKGNATCVMNFNGAHGWIVGEPHRGLASMFVMMNSARLAVGLQGLGHAEIAYQNGCRYAAERPQMRAVIKPSTSPGSSVGGADPIAFQPAIRKILLTLRAFVEGERAMGYWCAHLLDIAEHHPDIERRTEAHDQVSLLTPVVKSFFTENGFTLSSAALQVWGGYGYLHDYGIEQSVRDSRVAMIYEGTNEIQAIDLLVRKVIGDGGIKFRKLLKTILQEATVCAATPGCEPFGDALKGVHDQLSTATDALIGANAENPEYAHRIATDYLRLCGLTVIGSLWARAARTAAPRTLEAFYRTKMETAQFYFDYVFPETQLRIDLINKRKCSLPWVEAD